jgi:CDP-paratose 2-epimerase
MHVLITGGAGFVGSNLAIMLASQRGCSVTSFDNLRRRGSELALARLRSAGVRFEHGDIRNPEDLSALPAADLIIECSAEPSVHAGYDDGTRYLVNTNLTGTFNCLEWARRHQTPVIFLSTSRVYSIAGLRGLPLHLDGRRLALPSGEAGPGWSGRGIAVGFSTRGARSLYGTTKLASELLIEEYAAAFGIRSIVNRCGVITGPWQMGKVDQGFFVLWAARHLYGGRLAYTGFGGDGRQVRDVLHVADLFDLICRQIDLLDNLAGQTFNVGGGHDISVSLAELSELCAEHTGNRLEIGCVPETNAVDVPYYVTDNSTVAHATGWTPNRSVPTILQEVIDWLERHRQDLLPIFG